MKLLLIVIDAASPRVFCPAVQTGRLANLKRLADAGEMHEASATIFPSITSAATTSIITGTYPMETGIVGASWYDASRDSIAYYGDDLWVIAKEGFGGFLRDFLLNLNGDRLKAPTLFELIEQQGRSAGCLNYLVYRGLHPHKVHVPWLLAWLPGVPLVETVSGPTLLCLGDFVTGGTSGKHKPHHERGVLHRFGMDDASTAALLADVAAEGMPDFTVAYFADNDYRSHEVGPHGALPVLDRVDAALGTMFDAAGGFERFIAHTCVVVTSDHGHCEVLPDADAAVIRLDAVLSEFAQADVGGGWRENDDIMICPNMRAAQVYLHRPSPPLLLRTVGALLAEPRIDLVMWRDGADGDAYAVRGPRGTLRFWRDEGSGRGRTDAYGTSWAWDGDLGLLAMEHDGRSLESADYPNAFERIAGALDADQSGDLWVTAQPGCEFEVRGGKPHVGGASHGALHALDSLSPVVVAGARRRLPRAMRSVDIAPLCMETLGLNMRYSVGAPRVSTRREVHR